MSTFAPVHLPEGRELAQRASQTFLRHYNGCPRSAFFYQSHKGTVRTVEMMRGAALHAVLERATKAMIAEGEPTVPPEVVKAIVNEVLAEMPVPLEEHDYIREMAYRWGGEWAVDPSAVLGCETLIVLELEGWQVRCKVDFAELRPGTSTVRVVDYKTARGAPSYEEVGRKVRADGRLSAKSFQLVLYALVLAFGRPVRIETRRLSDELAQKIGVSAAWRRQEIPEPFALAPHADLFECEYVYPGIEDSEGRMLRRTVYLDRLELAEYRESLIALLKRVAASEESDDWPAVISDAACSECPCPSECPIPVELRDHRGTINTLEEAKEAALLLDRRSAIDSSIRREIKAFAKAHGLTVPVGEDREWTFELREKRELRDRTGLERAIDEATQLGRSFSLDDWYRTSVGTNFVVRKIEEAPNGD